MSTIIDKIPAALVERSCGDGYNSAVCRKRAESGREKPLVGKPHLV
jgi:hypothetical protein